MNEIRTQSINKKTPFNRWNIVRHTAMEFSEDPKFRINGKDISIKEVTNNAAVDTNIYEVIEKYRGDLQMSAQELNQFHQEVADELTNIKSLPDALMQIKAGEEAWKNLPLNIRQNFGNSIQKFLKNGSDYLNQKINEYKTQLEKENQINQKIEPAEKQNLKEGA